MEETKHLTINSYDVMTKLNAFSTLYFLYYKIRIYIFYILIIFIPSMPNEFISYR